MTILGFLFACSGDRFSDVGACYLRADAFSCAQRDYHLRGGNHCVDAAHVYGIA